MKFPNLHHKTNDKNPKPHVKRLKNRVRFQLFFENIVTKLTGKFENCQKLLYFQVSLENLSESSIVYDCTQIVKDNRLKSSLIFLQNGHSLWNYNQLIRPQIDQKKLKNAGFQNSLGDEILQKNWHWNQQTVSHK